MWKTYEVHNNSWFWVKWLLYSTMYISHSHPAIYNSFYVEKNTWINRIECYVLSLYVCYTDIWLFSSFISFFSQYFSQILFYFSLFLLTFCKLIFSCALLVCLILHYCHIYLLYTYICSLNIEITRITIFFGEKK